MDDNPFLTMRNEMDAHDGVLPAASSPPVASTSTTASPTAPAAPTAGASSSDNPFLAMKQEQDARDGIAPGGAAAAPNGDTAPTWGGMGKQFGAGVVEGVPNAVTGTADLAEIGVTPSPGWADLWKTMHGDKDKADNSYSPVIGGVLQKGMSAVGVNPNDWFEKPKNASERIANTAGQFVGQSFIPGVGPEGGVLSKVAKGAAAGTGAGIAHEVAPDSMVAPIIGAVAGQGLAEAPGVLAGTAKKVAQGVPLTDAQKEAAAVRGIEAQATNPTQFRADILANKQGPGLETSPQTASQMTQDPKIAAMEGRLARSSEEGSALFKGVEARQSAAQVEALQQATREGQPGAVQELGSKLIQEVEDRTQAAVDAATRAQQSSHALLEAQDPEMTGEAMRGVLERGRRKSSLEDQNLEDVGAAMRAPIETAWQKGKESMRQMWGAIDPEGRAQALVNPIKGAAKSLYGSGSLFDVAPAETAIAKKIGAWGDRVPLVELSMARAEIAQAMRQAGNGTAAHARLSQLRQGVEDSLNHTLAEVDRSDRAAVQAGQMAPDQTMSARMADAADGLKAAQAPQLEGEAGRLEMPQTDQNVGNVYYPGGNMQVRYELAEHGDLIPSHGPDFETNPNYPQAMQPRDRSTMAARDQVNNMAAQMNPEQLGRSAEVNSGAPIVGMDNVVESGNGRTIALGKMSPERKAQYRAFLESQGHDTSGFENPVLVARRITPMSQAQREYMASSAVGSGLRQGATEQAFNDAKLLTDDVIAKGKPLPIEHPDNAEFVRAMLGKMPASERGALLDPKGVLSQRGIDRVRAAVAARAYGDSGLVEKVFSSADTNIRNIGKGLVDAAIPWAQMRTAVREGSISLEHDVTPAIMDDVRDIMRARSEGVPIQQMLNQGRLIGGEAGEAARDLLFKDQAKGEVASGSRIAANLRTYAEEAVKNQRGMFNDAASPAAVARAAAKKAARESPDEGVLGAPTHEGGAGVALPEGWDSSLKESLNQRSLDVAMDKLKAAGVSTLERRIAAARVYHEAGHRILVDSESGAVEFKPPRRGEDTQKQDFSQVEKRMRSAYGEKEAAPAAAPQGVLEKGPTHETGAGEGMETDKYLMDRPTAERQRAAVAATREFKEQEAPILPLVKTRSGYATGDMKVGDAQVMDRVWKPGGTGKEAVSNYLRFARRDPEAAKASIEALKSAAKLSLKKAEDVTGTITPEAMARWKKAYGEPLAVLERAAPGFTKELGKNVDVLSTEARGVLSKADASIPSKVFRSNENGGGRLIGEYLKHAKGDKQAIDALAAAAADSLAKKMRQGDITPEGLEQWRAAHSSSLEALERVRPGTIAQYENAASATRALGDAMVAQKEAVKAARATALSKFIADVRTPDDVVDKVGRIFQSPTKNGQFTALVKDMHGNEEALAGLRNAVGEFISKKFLSNNQALPGAERGLKNDAFQTFIRENQPELALVMGPEQAQRYIAVADDLQKMKMREALTVRGNSGTAQYQSQMNNAAVTGRPFESMLAGAILGGHVPGLGHGVGAIMGKAFAHLRAHGYKDVHALQAEMLANPEMLREAMARVPATKAAQGSRIGRILRAGAQAPFTAYATGQGRQ